MMQQSIKSVKIGNLFSPDMANVSVPGTRTLLQYKAVMEWHKKHPSIFWSFNPFEDDLSYGGDNYKCTFLHVYYREDGKMEVIRVTPTGKITYCYATGDDFPQDVKNTMEKYGLFRGV